MTATPDAYTLRRARPDDIPAVIALADRVFRSDGKSSMGTEFPLFLSCENADNIHIATHGNDVVSMLGVCFRTLLLQHASLPSAMIGAVAPDEQHRGHGLAGALLDNALADARARGVAVVFISGGRGLYQRRGARYTGALSRCAIPHETWRSWRAIPDVVWRPYESADCPALFQLHLQQLPRFLRTPADMDVMIRARTCGAQTFTACRNGQPVAYVVFKSIRESATICEYNGDSACVGGITSCLPPGFAGALEFLLSAQHPL